MVIGQTKKKKECRTHDHPEQQGNGLPNAFKPVRETCHDKNQYNANRERRHLSVRMLVINPSHDPGQVRHQRERDQHQDHPHHVANNFLQPAEDYQKDQNETTRDQTSLNGFYAVRSQHH